MATYVEETKSPQVQTEPIHTGLFSVPPGAWQFLRAVFTAGYKVTRQPGPHFYCHTCVMNA